MVTFDSTAQVFEAWTDSTGAEWIGAFDTYSEARDAVRTQVPTAPVQQELPF